MLFGHRARSVLLRSRGFTRSDFSRCSRCRLAVRRRVGGDALHVAAYRFGRRFESGFAQRARDRAEIVPFGMRAIAHELRTA